MTFDGLNRRIILNSSSVTAQEIWSAWINWHRDNKQWGLALRQVGGDSLGSGLYIPPYVFLQEGWKIRPMESNHQLSLVGNLFTEDGSSPLVNTLGNFNVIAKFTVPVQAQGISTGGSTSSGLTSLEHDTLIEISKVLTNNKELKDNQLIIYDDDGATPLFTWNLRNKQGAPTENQVYKSELV